MRLYVDVEKSFEHGIAYMGVSNWLDFSTKEVKGVEIHCINLATFEKFKVRIKSAEKQMFVNGGIKMLFYGGLKMLFFGGNKCLLLADRFFI